MPEQLSKAKLKFLRSLTTSKGRDKERFFLAEGVRIVADGIGSGLECRAVVFDDYQLHEREALQKLATRAGDLAFVVDPEDFEYLSDTVNSQGVIAAFARPDHSPRVALSRSHCTLLVLDNIRDPGNAGAIVRHAAAFGCTGVFLLKGCVDPYNPKAVRASMGGIFTVPLEADCSPEEVLNTLNENTVWTYVADNDISAKSALSIQYAPKTAFIIGGETEGVQPYWSEQQVIKVTIPQTAHVDSLNGATAASILLCNRFQGTTGSAAPTGS